MDIDISDAERQVFASALRRLNGAGVPFVVAGAFCMHYYTGIWRNTKDMDVFAMPESVPHALAALQEAGYKTWIEADHWLGKAMKQGFLVDVIFGSGNWLAPMDSIWLERARPAELLGERVLMSPIEEMIWAKSYIAGRERYDGADVCHLISSVEGKFDWDHLLWRYNDHWQLLLSYLHLYSFIYPGNQNDIPEPVLEELHKRLDQSRKQASRKKRVCRGTLLDRFSYNFDVEHRGYVDARVTFAKAQGVRARAVVNERAWASERLAKGEVYKQE